MNLTDKGIGKFFIRLGLYGLTSTGVFHSGFHQGVNPNTVHEQKEFEEFLTLENRLGTGLNQITPEEKDTYDRVFQEYTAKSNDKMFMNELKAYAHQKDVYKQLFYFYGAFSGCLMVGGLFFIRNSTLERIEKK